MFSQGPVPRNPPICLINRENKPMARPLISPPLPMQEFDWRALGRRIRQGWGVQPHLTARGVCRPKIAANAGQYWPERHSDAHVGRQDAIAPTPGSAGAPMSHLCSRGHKNRHQTGGREGVGKRRGAKVRSGNPCRCRWRQ